MRCLGRHFKYPQFMAILGNRAVYEVFRSGSKLYQISYVENCDFIGKSHNISDFKKNFRKQNSKKKLFKQPVVRCFIGDQDIMRVTLGHTGIGDPDKLCVLLHLADSFCT